MEADWNARVFDHSGMTEIGPLAIECFANPGGLHVLEDDYYAEVIEPRLKKAFVYHLLDGGIFSWQLAAGQCPEFETRLDRFANRITAAIRETDAQEVLIVGHSPGTTVA